MAQQRTLLAAAPQWSLALLMVLTAALVACGPPPKPAELQELEKMRNDSFTAQINTAAPNLLEQADKFHKMAVTAWQEGDAPRAADYAWLGQLRYKTAKSKAKSLDEQARYDEAAAKVTKANQEVEVNKLKIDGLNKSIAQLEQTVAAYDQNASMKRQSTVDQVLLTAEGEREKAKAVNAAELAAGKWNFAENVMKLTQEHLTAGRVDEALKSAEEAKVAYMEAYAVANPEFDKASASATRAEREKALYVAASSAFSVDALQDQRGVVVVMPRVFDLNKTTVLEGKAFMLDAAVKIATDFPETTVMIEGYTQSKGSDSKNLTISQSRADSVRDYLVQKGVDPKRCVSSGYGEEKPRYDNSSKDDRGKNDRVEVVFVMTK